MKHTSAAEVRQSFLAFFAQRGHTIVPSASLVPVNDPTLLFTNAGMNQFKDVFLGLGTRPYTRAVDTQKVMRVSGKHNDLDDVGRDTYHHTFFEMLGNWSFGDYYKQEAIRWAWQLLVDVWGLEGRRIWATVFEDELGELETDEEARGFWLSETGIHPDQVAYAGRKFNFWQMADTGPCGPCSEIHYDLGPEACRCQDDPHHVCRVNADCGRYMEIWNLVFIQYNKDASGLLEPLPDKHIDTGAGFERLLTILQGVDSNYKTDLFTPLIRRVQDMLDHTDADVEEHIVAYRVIADHARAVTFLIGDGVLPGSEGRNYVLRMILRRAVRFGRELGLTEPFLARVAEVVIDTMGQHFPELVSRRAFILNTVTQEEERFLRTLDTGLDRLHQVMDELAGEGETVIPGDEAFYLYDTLGLPLEITRDVAEERGFSIDQAGYTTALEEQRRRARQAEGFEMHDEQTVARYQRLLLDLLDQGCLGGDGVDQDPYSCTATETQIVAILRDGEPVEFAEEGDRVGVVVPETCFYAEAGGQVSDTGSIAPYQWDEEQQPAWKIEVEDARQPVPGLVVHIGEVEKGRPQVGDRVLVAVDRRRRMDVARNHTATHLLQTALRHTLGDHVQQAGSLVAPDRLRFDFSHPAMLTPEELEKVTKEVNEAILANYPVASCQEPYGQALNEGVIALFGEKYGDVVRVLRVGDPDQPFSRELCGGTHVDETGEIGAFHIVSQESVGAGVRRLEAVTGHGAVDFVERQLDLLDRTAAHLGVPPHDLEQRAREVQDELTEAQKEIQRLQQRLAHQAFQSLLDQVEMVSGVPMIAARVEAPSVDVLREMTDWFRDRLDSGVFILGTVLDGRPAFVASVTPDAVEQGADAVEIVRGLGRVVGGGGGGRPTMAQAGGSDPSKLDDALAQAAGILKKQLEG
ncbi:MAG: alanine--tRNA ligase [Anaerolineae bacterium]|jgi:alanyl-tRNA synthetase